MHRVLDWWSVISNWMTIVCIIKFIKWNDISTLNQVLPFFLQDFPDIPMGFWNGLL